MRFGWWRRAGKPGRPEEAVESRYLADPRFRTAFNDAYSGEAPPHEAVRRFAHPRASGLDGSPSPAEQIAGLRRTIYSGRATPEDRAIYLEAAVRVSQDEATTARAIALATQALVPTRRSALGATALRIGTGAVAGGLTVLAIVLSTSDAATVHPASHAGPTTAAARPIALPSVPDPRAGGRTLARLSNSSPPVGGQLQSSGTSAFQTGLIRRPQGQVMLTVACRGGDRLLVVLGDSGLSNGNFLLLTCPPDETSTIQSIVPAAVSAEPFRLVVYQRQPVTWKLLLSTYPVE